jgi:hypothetical protein
MRPLLLALSFSVSASVAAAQGTPAPGAQHAIFVMPDRLSWGPGPAGLPPGAQAAVLQGDPEKAETFTLRLSLPDGYRVPPHSHPADELITVLEGGVPDRDGRQVRRLRADHHAAGRRVRSLPAGNPPLRSDARKDRRPGARDWALEDQLRESRRRSAAADTIAPQRARGAKKNRPPWHSDHGRRFVSQLPGFRTPLAALAVRSTTASGRETYRSDWPERIGWDQGFAGAPRDGHETPPSWGASLEVSGDPEYY